MKTKTNWIFIAKTAAIFSVIPILVWSYASGPDVGKSGAPAESTCAEAGCHNTFPLNSGTGSVSVTFPGGLTYVPGVKQHWVVSIEESSGRRWGFQLTARLASNTNTSTGQLAVTDPNTSLACGANARDLNPAFRDFGETQTCPASKPLQFIEHSLTGSSRNKTGSQTFEFDWTPPSSNVGDIKIYVSGNAANGDANNTGDRIYTNSYTLTPSAGGPVPTISANGVVNGASFAPGIVPNSWFTIQGTNLSTTTNTWEKAIVNGNLPTSLDGLSVSVAGKPAYIYFVSPTQVNAVAPDVGTGTMSVTVTNSLGTSAAATVNSSTVQPAFFLWPNNQPVATRQDFSFAVRNGTFSGVNTIPAKPGDVIILWGTGFGPTNPAAPFGVQIPSTSTFLTASPVTVSVGGTSATVFGAAMAPGFAGLFQVAIQIPSSLADGNHAVIATINGAQSLDTTLITVQR